VIDDDSQCGFDENWVRVENADFMLYEEITAEGATSHGTVSSRLGQA
jgi:hypothetical protein